MAEETPPLHLIKLCVGCDSVADLAEWQAARRAEALAAGRDPRPRHITRMFPTKQAELLNGGSLYWVIQGIISCRQQLLALDEVTGADGIKRCALILSPEIIRTHPRPRRPFQGWRYLPATDAPDDLRHEDDNTDMPEALRLALAEIGIRS